MKKILFVLVIFLLGILGCPAAAADDCETCVEVLIEPVPHYMVVKFIIFEKFEGDKMELLSSFVRSLKDGSDVFYLYEISFSEGEHGNGHMSDLHMFSGSKNPTWTVSSYGFYADAGYAFSGWEIYGDVYQTGDRIVLIEYNTKATAVWQMV